METVLDALAIQKLLPHRYPFLLVDRIIDLVPREKLLALAKAAAERRPRTNQMRPF